MKHLSTLVMSLAAAMPLAAQAPPHVAQFLGAGFVINDMNLAGEVVGWGVADGQVQAFVAGPNHAHEWLPRPPGAASAWAQGINDLGVVVGSVASGSFPEYGQAVAWRPDGAGGWTIEMLGQLPGHTQSVAYDVNNLGDIVGVSILPGWQSGPSVWFNAPGGLLNIAALGAPGDPKEINDARVVVGINGGLFDLDTLVAQPLPPFTGNMNMFQGWAINDHDELAGTAYFGGVSRSASNWTQAGGWLSASPKWSLSANVTAFDINDAGVTTLEAPAPSAWFPGLGTFTLDALLVPPQAGQWAFSLSFGNAVNDLGQIAAAGQDLASGQSGIVLLTPAGVLADAFTPLGFGLAGASGLAMLSGSGTLQPGSPVSLALAAARPATPSLLVFGSTAALLPFKGGTLVPAPAHLITLTTDAAGGWVLGGTWPAGAPSGAELFLQVAQSDAGAPQGVALSNALRARVP